MLAAGCWLLAGSWQLVAGSLVAAACASSLKILERPKSVILTTASSLVSLSSKFSGCEAGGCRGCKGCEGAAKGARGARGACAW